jgi:hypothetical protein
MRIIESALDKSALKEGTIFWALTPCGPIKFTNNSEGRIASIFRFDTSRALQGVCPSVSLLGSLERKWNWKCRARELLLSRNDREQRNLAFLILTFPTLKMETICSSETSVNFYHT